MGTICSADVGKRHCRNYANHPLGTFEVDGHTHAMVWLCAAHARVWAYWRRDPLNTPKCYLPWLERLKRIIDGDKQKGTQDAG